MWDVITWHECIASKKNKHLSKCIISDSLPVRLWSTATTAWLITSATNYFSLPVSAPYLAAITIEMSSLTAIFAFVEHWVSSQATIAPPKKLHIPNCRMRPMSQSCLVPLCLMLISRSNLPDIHWQYTTPNQIGLQQTDGHGDQGDSWSRFCSNQINISKMFYLAWPQLPHVTGQRWTTTLASMRSSFSIGSLSSCARVSITIPKNVKQVVRPTNFSAAKARGFPNTGRCWPLFAGWTDTPPYPLFHTW